MSSTFHFKQFAVQQDACAMKVGTDAVLLGAWAQFSPASLRTLDIGTGTGVLALMLAQRYEMMQIQALEVEPLAAEQAEANFAASPFADRILLLPYSVQEFVAQTLAPFDAIICNPPYFDPARYLKAAEENPARQIARASTQLSFQDLLACAAQLLHPDTGEAFFIIPHTEQEHFINAAIDNHFYLARRTRVLPYAGKAPSRLLLHLTRKLQTPTNDEFVMHEDVVDPVRNARPYSEAYRQLVADFLTIF